MNNFFVLLIALLIPILQFGLTYWASSSVLVCLILGLIIFRKIISSRLRRSFSSSELLIFLLYPIIFASTLFLDTPSRDGSGWSFLLGGRITFFFMAQFFVVVTSIFMVIKKTNNKLVVTSILCIPVVATVALCLISFPAFIPSDLIREFYVSLQYQWLVQNRMFSSLDQGILRFVDWVNRPVATFGEPSYLSTVSLFLLFQLSTIRRIFNQFRIKNVSLIRSKLLSFMLSNRSLSFLIGFLAVLIIINRSWLGTLILLVYTLLVTISGIKLSKKGLLINKLLLVGFSFGALYLSLNIIFDYSIGFDTIQNFFDRLVSISQGTDVSAGNRIYFDITSVPVFGYGIHRPVNLDEVDNSVLELYINYGVRSLPFLLIILISPLIYPKAFRFKLEIFLSIFVIMNQNGSIFTPDKTFLICYIFYFYSSINILLRPSLNAISFP